MNVVKTSELLPGDVVLVHGMRCLIDGDLTVSRVHPGVVHWTAALVLNRDDEATHAVPRSWTREADGSHRWTIQGNDLATWAIEDREGVTA